MAATVPKVTLNNGLEVPIFGLGTWKSKPGEVTAAVKTAIDLGYRHIDCAHVYCNEKEVGEAISAKIAEGVVKREDLWITSKLWNTFHSPALVEPALKHTLSNLGLEYLDLYLIHWPMGFEENTGELFPQKKNGDGLSFSDVDYVDTWTAMEAVAKKGLTKSIGLSNFNTEQIDRVLKIATIKPVTNQVECHPYLNQKKLSAFCKERGILLTAYSPLGSPDRPWAKPGDPLLLEDAGIIAIAKRLGKSPAQVVLRYQIQLGNIVIPKSVTPARIAENLQIFDFELSADDLKLLDGFDRDARLCTNPLWFSHKHYPFNLPY